MNRFNAALGAGLARFLEKQTPGYVPFAVTAPKALRANLKPGDVLLVEGDKRISAAIKYLTHSTWSHAAFFTGGPADQELIEADLQAGVRAVPVSAYQHLNTRICRPVGLSPEDMAKVIGFMRGSIGKHYDLKNVIDLARYLLPTPPVPQRFRRRMLALGSGDPTRAICSSLIAEAFQSVRYPILPRPAANGDSHAAEEIEHIRHYSLYTPRDFDLSPFFRVVKPTLEAMFDYKQVVNYGG
ncbi:YiiX/YebB-like N1pC/P60 family cysteine hydrolase [Rhodobacter ferrooxidans]|uniref:Lipoprotein-like protein n=1 Tax=Rhodobacter ferrooxidans TaxID=371731 RepID=C8RY94_9RHOB|nr:YiiX/YebB-like N1pC/P60 family cysteine hydrolase [Rhodobacter sp. SW2]EEW26492.1 lipoprotein-like protein [Rhodobacter sp. SW2]